ncbi:MAG: undecaprenyl-diphosphate phosphatase [Patescibacteria group bacterium]
MNFIHVLILSIVEGITEFLPISSTGHLILASKLLSITPSDFSKTFDIGIQLGAIMAVVVLYYKKFIHGSEIYKKLLVAFIPSALVGLVLYPFIKGFLLGSSTITLLSLFLGGLILIFYKGRNDGMERIGYKEALKIGIFQSISVVPGVSRAAATILGGMFSGLSRKASVEFSFLLAVPTMLGATALDIYKSRGTLSSGDLGTLVLGMALSFVFAAIAVKFLIGYVKKHDFTVFGVYRIILAVLFYLFVK